MRNEKSRLARRLCDPSAFLLQASVDQLALRFFIQPYPPAARPAKPSMTKELASGTLEVPPPGGFVGGFVGGFGPLPGRMARAGDAERAIVRTAVEKSLQPVRFVP
jgi:hypothetical protein